MHEEDKQKELVVKLYRGNEKKIKRPYDHRAAATQEHPARMQVLVAAPYSYSYPHDQRVSTMSGCETENGTREANRNKKGRACFSPKTTAPRVFPFSRDSRTRSRGDAPMPREQCVVVGGCRCWGMFVTEKERARDEKHVGRERKRDGDDRSDQKVTK